MTTLNPFGPVPTETATERWERKKLQYLHSQFAIHVILMEHDLPAEAQEQLDAARENLPVSDFGLLFDSFENVFEALIEGKRFVRRDINERVLSLLKWYLKHEQYWVRIILLLSDEGLAGVGDVAVLRPPIPAFIRSIPFPRTVRKKRAGFEDTAPSTPQGNPQDEIAPSQSVLAAERPPKIQYPNGPTYKTARAKIAFLQLKASLYELYLQHGEFDEGNAEVAEAFDFADGRAFEEHRNRIGFRMNEILGTDTTYFTYDPEREVYDKSDWVFEPILEELQLLASNPVAWRATVQKFQEMSESARDEYWERFEADAWKALSGG